MVRGVIVGMTLMLGCDEKADAPAPRETKVAEAKTPDAKADAKAAPEPASKVEPKPPVPTVPSFESHTGSLWNDRAEGIAALEGGGFAVVGRCEPVESGRESEWDACVTIFDSGGNRLASAKIGGTGTDEVFEAAVGTKDDGVLAVGAAVSGRAREAKVVQFDKDAKVVWERAWGGEGDHRVLAILPAADGGWILSGYSGQPHQSFDAAVWWLDEKGNELRARTFGGAQIDVAHAIAATADGFVLAGLTSSKGAGKKDAWVLRIDAVGEQLWERTYGGATDDGAFALVVEPSGEIVIAGGSDGAAWIARLDGKGELLGEQKITTAKKILGLARTPDAIVGVGTGADGPLTPAWTARFDASLNPTNERVFAPPRLAATDVIATSDGGVVLTGDWPSPGSGYANFWLCKLDATGGGCA